MGFTSWVIFAVLIAAFLPFAYFMFKRESRMLGRLAVALGGENKSSVLGGNYVKLDSQGVELQIRLMPGCSDSGHGSQLIILRKTPLSFCMKIRSSSWAARLSHAVGLIEDIAVGDFAIDERYQVKANNEEKAIAFFKDPQRCEALEYFFDQGFTDIQLTENDVSVIKPQNRKSDLDLSMVKRHLEHFAMLFSS